MKPINCPRCGKPPQANEWKYEGREPIMMYFCANRKCPDFLNRTLTIEQWNQVTYPPEVQAVIEAAKEIRNELSWVYRTGTNESSLSKEYYCLSANILSKFTAAVRALEEMEAQHEAHD